MPNIPKEGQIFRDPDSQNVYINRGGKIYSYDLSVLGGGVQDLVPDAWAKPAGWTQGTNPNYNAALTAGTQKFQSQYGVSVGSLPTYNMGDVYSAYQQVPGTQYNNWGDFSYTPVSGSAAWTPGTLTQPSQINGVVNPTEQLAANKFNVVQGSTNQAATIESLYPGITAANPKVEPVTPLQNEIASRASAPATGTQKTLIDIYNSRPDLQKEFPDMLGKGVSGNWTLNDWWNKYGINEFPGVTLTQPSTVAPGAEQGVNQGYTAAGVDPKDAIIKQLTQSLQKCVPAGTLENAYKEAQKAAGVSTLEGQVGSFEQEIQRTQSLLTDLENRVKSTQATEENRLAPMDIIGARKTAVSSAVDPTRQDLLKTLSLTQTSRSQLLETLQRKNTDILTQLGLKEKDLENLKLDTQTIGNAETGYYQILTDKDGNIVKTTELIKGTGTDKFSEPYKLGGDWVQKNEKTGEIKVAVNVPAPTSSPQTTDWATKLGIATKDATKFSDELQRQYERVLAGTYGTQGAREKAGQAMVAQFPQYTDAVWKAVYGKPDEGINALFPDGYESQIKQSSSQQDVPKWQYDLGVRSGMNQSQIDTILNSNKTVTDTMNQMKDVFQQYKDAGWSKTDAKNEWKKQNSATTIPGAIDDLFNEVFGTNWIGQ